MQNIFILTLFCFLSSQGTVDAFPTEEISGYRDFENQRERNYEIEDATSSTIEPENKTGIISSVWHKFSNIFGGETTITAEPELRKEVLMPEDNGRDQRRNFNRQSEGGTWQQEKYDEGNFYPIHPRLRKRRSSFHGSLDVHTTEVRKGDSFKNHNPQIKYITERLTDSAVKKVPVTIEEFNQAENEGGRMKRFKNSQKSTDWKTETIVVGSDPVESIDNTNYIEETKESDFPFHIFSAQPIIIEDHLSGEMTTLSEKELSPLKIIEY